MARVAKGLEALEAAKEVMAKTKCARDLRVAQAVAFPLVNGMSLREAAEAVGRSVRWATKARNRFIRQGGLPQKPPAPRNRARMTAEAEAAFLAPFFASAAKGGALTVREIQCALERRIGRSVSQSSVYKLLHRHGWRKLALNKPEACIR